MERLAFHIGDRRILSLLGQYLRRTAEQGGWFWEHERGISRGCPLSPLVGAFFLYELDRRMEQSGVFYVRFMDDIICAIPLETATGGDDKTVIGRIERGFDFLGYHFSRTGLAVAKATLATFVERTDPTGRGWSAPSGPAHKAGSHVRRWVGWAGRNVSFVMVAIPCGR